MRGHRIVYFGFMSPADRKYVGWLDLRSADASLRHQLQDVVRRAAAVQPSPAFAAGPGFAPRRPSAAQRLQELAALHANEAISDAEYAERRRQIISEI